MWLNLHSQARISELKISSPRIVTAMAVMSGAKKIVSHASISLSNWKFLGLFSTPLLMLITNRSIIEMKKYWFLKFNKNAIWRLCWLWLEGRSGVVGKLEGGYFFPLVSMQQSLRMWKEIYWNYLSSTPNKSLLKITRKCLQSEKRKCVGNHADILSELFVVILRVSTFTSDISRYISSLISLRLTFDWNPKPNTTFCFH